MKNAWCIVAADGARARFFTLEPSARAELEGGPDLVEQDDLVNPEHVAKPIDRFANVQSGRTAPKRGPAHGLDDHRTRHIEETESRFAKRVSQVISALLVEKKVRHLVLCADPRMLGLLRTALADVDLGGAELREHAKDVSRLGATQLQASLAEAGLVPPRRRPPSLRA
jgi:protein required for attachment to host cells